MTSSSARVRWIVLHLFPLHSSQFSKQRRRVLIGVLITYIYTGADAGCWSTTILTYLQQRRQLLSHQRTVWHSENLNLFTVIYRCRCRQQRRKLLTPKRTIWRFEKLAARANLEGCSPGTTGSDTPTLALKGYYTGRAHHSPGASDQGV